MVRLLERRAASASLRVAKFIIGVFPAACKVCVWCGGCSGTRVLLDVREDSAGGSVAPAASQGAEAEAQRFLDYLACVCKRVSSAVTGSGGCGAALCGA